MLYSFNVSCPMESQVEYYVIYGQPQTVIYSRNSSHCCQKYGKWFSVTTIALLFIHIYVLSARVNTSLKIKVLGKERFAQVLSFICQMIVLLNIFFLLLFLRVCLMYENYVIVCVLDYDIQIYYIQSVGQHLIVFFSVYFNNKNLLYYRLSVVE